MARTEKGLLLDKILVHPGQQYLGLLNAHSLSYWIFTQNAAELRTQVSALEDPKNAEDFFARNSQNVIQATSAEVSRRMHNLTASSKTLVDHTRALMNNDRIKRKHWEEYERRKHAAFVGSPIVGFMHDLRNYTLHYAIPWAGIQVTKTVGTLAKGSVNIDLDGIKTWDGWKAPSRSFIERNLPKIRVLQLVDDYETKLRDFYQPFSKEFESYYAEEIRAVQDLWREFNTPSA